ncbi:MAG: prolyl oligopeptidase family serine peptidase [Pseudomonadales bacterium]|jgi:dipeptidyl aminopeptidase/acylaminoacyl peptidase|nr:prolyl oligopeptidase family serine peptidase [Pseudomonadales bacterium]
MTRWILPLCLVLSAPLAAAESDAPSGYRQPSQAIIDIVDAPAAPIVELAPGEQTLALIHPQALPSIEDLARPELRLAGLRFDPQTHGPSRGRTAASVELVDLETRAMRSVSGLPQPSKLGDFEWSPDGRFLAFTHTTSDGVRPWVLDAATGRARELASLRLNAVFGDPCDWSADSSALVCRTVPEDAGTPPERPRVPRGPNVRAHSGAVEAAARTYQDLLKDAFDERLFAWYARAQLVRIPLEGRPRALGAPGLLRSHAVSPDGRYLLVTALQQPFSLLVPYYRFAQRTEVRDASGERVRVLAELPLAEDVPIGRDAARSGLRTVAWLDDLPASVYLLEALDGGDPSRDAERRDRLWRLDAPFEGEPVRVADLALRAYEVEMTDAGQLVVTERWWRDRRLRSWLLDPAAPDDARVIEDRSVEDRYADPGRPLTRSNAFGREVVATHEGSLYRAGLGASPEGDRPFLDRVDLATGEATRLWRSSAPEYEAVAALVDPAAGTVLTLAESPDQPPNLFLRTGDTRMQLSDRPHPYPHMRGIHKEIVRYEREDGVPLSGTLYLPPGKRPEDGPFPTLLWAYPREFKSAEAAGQMRGSPHRFNRIRYSGPLPLLAAGYAVFDGPTMPIVGEGDAEPNDAYVEQLVSSAEAAVDVLVERGISRRDAIAVGGHSYGAFMTANLLAHSDLFATGIARSGAYNRSLTPFGFQAEERTFWEAPEVYFAMSPFMNAAKITEPVLMIHGEADNNSGTFPLQSQRFYNALKGLGVEARLVMLPEESHGYRARESVLHNLWEMETWLDRQLAWD